MTSGTPLSLTVILALVARMEPRDKREDDGGLEDGGLEDGGLELMDLGLADDEAVLAG